MFFSALGGPKMGPRMTYFGDIRGAAMKIEETCEFSGLGGCVGRVRGPIWDASGTSQTRVSKEFPIAAQTSTRLLVAAFARKKLERICLPAPASVIHVRFGSQALLDHPCLRNLALLCVAVRTSPARRYVRSTLNSHPEPTR